MRTIKFKMTLLTDRPGLCVEAVPDGLPGVLEFIDSHLADIPCSEKERMHLKVSAEEIFINITSYAYNGKEGIVFIQVDVSDNPPQAVIRFFDEGKPWNPLEHEDPDVSLPANEREPGGLGIFMAKNLMTNMEYERADGLNILTLTKLFGNT